MAADLFTPILNDRTRSVRFFNGRLLSGEAMTDEQSGQRAARELLAQAVGEGIAQGFEVKEAAGLSTTLAPVLAIASGVAINRRGEILLLNADTEVKLIRPAHQATAPASVFQTCTPPTQGVYVADSGVYLLTVCSLGAANGLAQVSGLGGLQASCNAKYIVDAVQFRLIEVPVDAPMLSDVPHLRNRVAYQCFGAGHASDFATDPFGTAGEPRTLLDEIRDTKQLTDCDVPLALMYWTATGGIQFLDMWSVRRRVTRTASPEAALEDARLAVAEAMLLQFQEHLAALATSPVSTALSVTGSFRHLPPFGMVPVGSTPGRDFSLLTFFASLKTRGPFYIEGSRAASVARQALQFFPIDIESHELIWLYRIRENQQAIDDLTGATPRTALLFVTGHASWRGDAHYDVSKWNYANYA
jgi:hypothetical protein